jgi:lipoprotein-anchoring transpeptidase ErfK/SrfK
VSAPSIRIDLSRQELALEASGKVLFRCPVSSGKAGAGFEEGSGKTPTGRFRICRKIGDGEPEDTIFLSRLPVGRYPGAIPEGLDEHSDLILSRILWLDGLEPENANTRERYIYIHGTNHPELLGTPESHGCIRLSPADMLVLFDLVEEGTVVSIHL